jgi:hypothetical protein
MVLRGVTQPIDGLKGKRLFLRKELDLTVAQTSPYASVEAYRFLLAPLSNPTSPAHDGCFQQHLERVIELDQDSAHATPLVRSVEKLDGQEQRVASFTKEKFRFAFHESACSSPAPSLRKDNLATENLAQLHRARMTEDGLAARDREIVVFKEFPLRRKRASTIIQSEVI